MILQVLADELTNVSVAAVVAFILGLVFHSAYIHSERYKKHNYPWNHAKKTMTWKELRLNYERLYGEDEDEEKEQ